MGMYYDEAAGDKILDGTEGCVSMLHHSGNWVESGMRTTKCTSGTCHLRSLWTRSTW